MYVVDASVWVSRFVLDDANHEISQAWIEDQLAGAVDLFEPALLFPELAGSVARRTRQRDLAIAAMSALESLENVRTLSLHADLWWRAGTIAASLRLGGADAVYIAVAEMTEASLVTWDGQQRTRGANLVPTATPAELLSGPSQ